MIRIRRISNDTFYLERRRLLLGESIGKSLLLLLLFFLLLWYVAMPFIILVLFCSCSVSININVIIINILVISGSLCILLWLVTLKGESISITRIFRLVFVIIIAIVGGLSRTWMLIFGKIQTMDIHFFIFFILLHTFIYVWKFINFITVYIIYVVYVILCSFIDIATTLHFVHNLTLPHILSFLYLSTDVLQWSFIYFSPFILFNITYISYLLPYTNLTSILILTEIILQCHSIF